MRPGRAPAYLFRWMTAPRLDEMAGRSKGGRVVLSGGIPKVSILYRCYPQLRRRRVLFAWSHPVAGMASHPGVVYAGASPNEARVLTMKIKRSARVIRLTTPNPCRRRREITVDLDKVDLIFHTIRFRQGGFVKEWIVLNPNVIAEASAHPGVLRRFFMREVRRLKDSRYRYPRSALHNHSPSLKTSSGPVVLSVTAPGWLRRTVVVPRLKAVLALRAMDIPAGLRKPMRLPISLRR